LNLKGCQTPKFHLGPQTKVLTYLSSEVKLLPRGQKGLQEAIVQQVDPVFGWARPPKEAFQLSLSIVWFTQPR